MGRGPDVGQQHRSRRLQQALRTFRQYFPRGSSKRVRKDLRKAMKAAGELRNYDIAVELLANGGGELPDVQAKRQVARTAFNDTLKSLVRKDIGVKWRSELGLHE